MNGFSPTHFAGHALPLYIAVTHERCPLHYTDRATEVSGFNLLLSHSTICCDA